ncbi:acetyltransferase [Penicillium angulare]|uniref:acetyltransferase n=1 Tax=Penicillium angulare TaxID=116970 RepID=UPI0025418473|nr:acetyltransferase [Penicillium angulare]KAJ5261294.1 acetyltransferase [Penicillium angulare]
MASSSPLKVEPITIDDIPALIEIWFAAFTNPLMQEIFPDTPGLREWLTKIFLHDLSNRPFQHTLKVMDLDSKDLQGRPRMMAWGKWDLSMPEERGLRFSLPWADDMPAEKCNGFFNTLEENRKQVMGDEKHFYLDTLCTHPDYWRRGAGSMLVQWGCDLADEQGVSAYVDASKKGAPLYQKFGFVDNGDPNEEVASMARRKS